MAADGYTRERDEQEGPALTRGELIELREAWVVGDERFWNIAAQRVYERIDDHRESKPRMVATLKAVFEDFVGV